MYTDIETALTASRTLTKRHGTSYYTAMLLLSGKTRDAVFALYGIVRAADEIVDTEETNPERARERLTAYQAAWHEALRTHTSSDPVLYAAAWAFHTYAIPTDLLDTFFEAMRMDTEKTRYETYADLEEYMYGSAAVIGRILAYMFGAQSPQAFAHAEALGYAMQLTNFLRDIREDYELRGRIYFPQDELLRFGIGERDIAEHRVTPAWKSFAAFQTARARGLYRDANQGVQYLTPSCRKAVRLARALYAGILDRIEDAAFDVFSSRRYTTNLQKLWYAAPIILRP